MSGKAARRELLGAEQIREIPVWVGREALLETLTYELVDAKRKVILLLGQGGIGKTSLAVKLLGQAEIDAEAGVLKPACPFKQVIYLRVGKGTGFDAVLQQMSQGMELKLTEQMKPEQMVDAVVQQLKQQRYLVVLDNFEDALEGGCCKSKELGELLWAMTDRPHQSQLILISREMVQDLVDPREANGLPNPMQVRVEQLPGIGTAASVALLKNYDLEDDEEDLQWVARRVGGHVLLLTLLAKLAIGKKGYLRKNPQLVSRNAEPILEEQLGRQAVAAVELLKRMCVPRGAIGAEGLTFLRLHGDGQEAEFGQGEVEQTELLLKQLSDASLVQRRFDEERCEELYDLHQVIVDFLQSKYTAELPELMQRVYEFYRVGSRITVPKSLEDLEMMLEAQHFAFQLCNYSEAWLMLDWYLIEKLYRWGHWSQLEELLLQISKCVKGVEKARCIGWLGIINRDTGNWDEAERLCQRSLRLREALGDRLGMATSWGILGDIERNRGNWDEAEHLHNRYLEIMEELGDRSGIATSLGLLGDIERNRCNWGEAERLYRQSLEVWEELGNRSGMAFSWEQLGYVEFNSNNWDEAERLHRQSLAVRKELGDCAGMASSWEQLVPVECNRGNWEEAERLCRKSLELREKLGDRSGVASSWGVLGDIERKQGNWEEAERLFRKCLEVEEELGNRSGMAYSLAYLGDIERNCNNWTQAEKFLRSALELMKELGDRWGIADVKCGLGENELDRGNLEQAESLFTETLQMVKELDSPPAIAETTWLLAKLHRTKGNPDLAQTHYATAHRLFTQLGAAKDLERIEKEWPET